VTDTNILPTESVLPVEPVSPAGQPAGEVAGEPWRVSLLAAVVLAIAYFGGVGWFLTIAGLLIMIFLHELGHYLAARRSGMKVTEFFLFFGPKIWSFRRGETEYGIKLLPLGAYVRIIGMSNLDTGVTPEDEPRTYRQQSYPKRLLVASAGSLMHFLQAIVLFFIAFSILGVDGGGGLGERLGAPAPPVIVGSVSEGSGAAAAGVLEGDLVVSIGGTPVESFSDVGPLVVARAGETVAVEVERNGESLTLNATLGRREEDSSMGFLGIGNADVPAAKVRVNPIEGAVQAVELTAIGMKETATSLVGFFAHDLGDFGRSVAQGSSVQGSDAKSANSANSGDAGSSRAPRSGDEKRLMSLPGIARIGASLVDEGLGDFLVFFALINISLGVLNMLPMLPLDGGHVVIATYERIRSTKGRHYMADVSRLIPLTYAVIMFFLIIGMSAIYLDVRDPIGLG
jgi:membrane-associated protease RseP (regulator of RpoE activity)